MSNGFEETTLRDLYHSHCAVLGVKPNSVLSRQLAGESGEGLTTLDVSKNYLGERGFQAFLQVVAEAVELVTLRLAGNGLTNDAVASLCRVAGAHPALRVIDLSNNPLSLPAATAVVAMLRKNVRVVSVVVAETFIEDRAKLKIARALERNQRLLTKAKAHEADKLHTAAAAAAAAPGGGAGAAQETPYEKVRREHEVRAAAAKAARVDRSGHPEETISMHMRRRVPVAPARGSDGWVVLGVWVSSTPTDFHTELQTIHRSVLPRMNAALRKRKVLLVPYSAHHEGLKAKAAEKQPHFTLAADGGAQQPPPPTYETPNCKLFSDDDTILSERLHLIDLCSPLFVMLVGDKHGPVPRFVPAYYASKPVFRDGFGVGNGVNTSATMAQIESGYGGQSLRGGGDGGGDRQASKPSLFFMRECCRCLNVPEGLMEAMTDDCAYLHVDSEGKMRPGLLECVTRDLYEKGKTRWEGWVAHKKALQANVPPAMVMTRYRSAFDAVNARGHILLKGQDGFARAFESRLGEVVDFLYPEEEEEEVVVVGKEASRAVVPFNECYQRRREYLEHLVESSATSGRNNSISKLELHLISPTSRNMLLVTGSRHAGIGSVMSLFVRKLLNKSAYSVASAVVGHASICEDSHSLRTLLLSLSSQILRRRAADATGASPSSSPPPPPCVPAHIVNEVRTDVLREYFKGVLADAAAALPDGRLLVIVVDGLEKVRYPPEPEASLLKTEGGKNVLELDGQMLAAGSGGRLGVGIVGGGGGAPSDHLDWIPKCLPKNVRLIASCEGGGATAGSETARRLLQRGQDCCEALEVLPPGVHEAEKAVRSALAQRCVRLSDELYYDHIMKKPCITDVVYRDLLAAHLVQRYERGPESTPKAFLESVPDDLDGLVSRMLDYAEGVSTPALVRRCLTALALVPDGLRLFEMRELLGRRAAGVHLLSGRDLELLLHGVRPFLARFLTGHKDYGPLVSVTAETQVGAEPAGGGGGASAAAEGGGAEEGEDGVVTSNGTLHRMQLSCGPVRERILARYVGSPEEKADAYAVLGRFFYALSELEDHPSTVLGLVSYPACMLQAGMWGTVMRYFFSISTVRRYFMHTVGYTMYTHMVDAHRVIHARLKELRIGGAAAPPGAKHDRQHTVEELDVWLHKVKEYTHFVVLNVTSLSTKPALSIQQGLLMHDGSTVCVEAAQYCEQHPSEAHFVCVNKTSLRMGRGTVASVAFSPNGLRLLACHEKSFTLTNTLGAVLHHYNASFTVVMGVVSPTSRYAAVVLVDKSILVYDAVTGACVAKLAGHTGRIRACVFTARSGYVVSGADDGCVRVWDSESGRVVATLCHRQFLCVTSSHASVAAVATHPTDERLFISAIDRTVLVWCRDCLEHTLRHKVIAHTAFPVKRLLWLFDGDSFLVQCKMPMRGSAAEPCQESCLRLYDGATAELKVRFEGAVHSCINDVAVDPSERLLAAALDDGTLVFWDLAAAVTAGGSAKPVAVIRAFCGSASRVVFYVHPAAAAAAAAEDGDEQAAPCATDDGPLPRQQLEGTGSVVLCAVTGDSNLLKVYNTETHALELEHVSHSSVADLAATPAPTAEGARLAVGDSTGRLYLLTERALATRQ